MDVSYGYTTRKNPWILPNRLDVGQFDVQSKSMALKIL